MSLVLTFPEVQALALQEDAGMGRFAVIGGKMLGLGDKRIVRKAVGRGKEFRLECSIAAQLSITAQFGRKSSA